MKWPEKLLNADKQMVDWCVKSGVAELRVQYYKDQNGYIRKRLLQSAQEIEIFYDKVPEKNVIED